MSFIEKLKEAVATLGEGGTLDIDALKLEHERELDQARNSASETAQKNAEKKVAIEVERLMKEKEEEANQTVEEKLAKERAKLEKMKNELAVENELISVRAKFLDNGYSEQQYESALPFFQNIADPTKIVESADKFLETLGGIVTARVDEQAQVLANGATPPPGEGSGKGKEVTSKIAELKAKRDEALKANNSLLALEYDNAILAAQMSGETE